jgi:hypothetical protein
MDHHVRDLLDEPLPSPAPRAEASRRSLAILAGAALPVGWLLLTLYLVLGFPQESWVLGTLIWGSLVPPSS